MQRVFSAEERGSHGAYCERTFHEEQGRIAEHSTSRLANGIENTLAPSEMNGHRSVIVSTCAQVNVFTQNCEHGAACSARVFIASDLDSSPGHGKYTPQLLQCPLPWAPEALHLIRRAIEKSYNLRTQPRYGDTGAAYEVILIKLHVQS